VLGAASYCAPLCAAGDAGCASDRACVVVNDVGGAQVSACVERGGACAEAPPPSDAGVDAAFDASSEVCGHLVGPDLPGGCTSACTDAGPKRCQTNGCYEGYWCDTESFQCEEAPNGGACGDHGPGAPYDAGPSPTGSVGLDGGTVSRLFFAIVGDTRPATQDDTANYPTTIISKIFTDVQGLAPSFAVSTGDYMFASPDGGEGASQLDLYLSARALYSGTVFATMGNHECTGATKSNCGGGNADGITNNFTAFLTKVLAPLGQTNPNYEIDVSASDASWTAKFLFVPGNAWTTDVSTWLDTAMSRPTTYTFLIRHEGIDSPTAPGVTPSESIMANHPFTLSIVGHDHIYTKSGPHEVTFGNGGAPPTGASNYGFGIVSQRADGAVTVDAIDYETGLADSTFHFAVNPDGSAAAP